MTSLPATLALELPGLPANLHWGTPWVLLLLVVPVVLLFIRIRRRPALALPTTSVAANLPKSFRQRFLWLPRFLLALSLAAAIVALARPQLGEGKVLTSTDAVAIQLVIDRSSSMGLAMPIDGQDLSRLDIVKRVVHDFLLGDGKSLAGRPADIIGLVQFAGFADTACPMIRDHRTLAQLVEAIPLAQRFEDGTAIGDGLALAAARLHTAEEDLKSRHTELADEDFRIKSKIMILLTDGDNNRGKYDPVEAAKLAAQWGIKVYTIGIGGDSYQVFHTPFGDQRIPVRGDVDEKTLKAIADATGGKFYRAEDGSALRDIYADIDRLEKSTVKTVDFTDYTELFSPIAMASAGLLAFRGLLVALWLRRSP
ncbi:MAG TPA: VWA domain-containing protein [Phycisphaerales bacterium]|jgi:Ca-activated chloride channel family protein|nr:VWA domain-containing protein [Phycisphaerales bacterium]